MLLCQTSSPWREYDEDPRMMREPPAGHVDDIAAAYSLCVARRQIIRCDVNSFLANMTSLVAFRCAGANIRALAFPSTPGPTPKPLQTDLGALLLVGL